MESILDFLATYWWAVIIGIAMLPTLFWGVIMLIGSIADDSYLLANYKDFWRIIVMQEDVRDAIEKTFVQKIFLNWYVVITNLISLFFIWGYVLVLIGCLLLAIWRCIRWPFRKIIRHFRGY